MFKFKYIAGFALIAIVISALFVPPVKDTVSKGLIDYAWRASLKSGEAVKPWPWINSHPVAKLSIPGQDALIVMSGDLASVMAYAPLWHEGTALPGEEGIALISGDRKKQFGVLKMLTPGDRFELISSGGIALHYQVEDIRVVSSAEIQLEDTEGESMLILSTAYPIKNSDTQNDLRASMHLIAVARKLDEPATVQMAGLKY